MRKWDGKPTSALQARVCELQGKTITKGDSVLSKNAAPVSSSQLSRQGRQFHLDYNPLEWTSKSFLQQVSSKFSDQDLESSYFQPGGGKGQPCLLDGVDLVAWHVRSTRV